jgi:hypothetical protein
MAAARNRLLERLEKPVIVSIDPQHGDERMAAQQGFFLCKLIGQVSFKLYSFYIFLPKPQRQTSV